ncbi:MAG: hypothetical protein ACI4KJ_00905 [Anaerovoracaceae bacterium]
MKQKYVYVVLSKTPSKFAKMIRTFGGMTYNHASIAFDEDLREMWAFARKKNNLPIDAGVVQEFPERFTLNKEKNVPIRVYRIPVNDEQFNKVHENVMDVHNDEDYHYNFFSMLFYPFAGGFPTDKAYTCSEFVATLLNDFTDIDMDKPCSSYVPEELHIILEPYLMYDGNLMDYREFEPVQSHFFDDVSPLRVAGTTLTILAALTLRSATRARREFREKVRNDYFRNQQ